ncbi:MAG TPA: glycoside hydrolase family 31 protein, partial [Candidatus Acidoferrales bacterium]|nr:glycoside hydrolase family 31 protein [Candidatus Acidoferrales bacterium]
MKFDGNSDRYDGIRRRDALKLIGAGAAAAYVAPPMLLAAQRGLQIAGKTANISVKPVSPHAVRILIAADDPAQTATALNDGALVSDHFDENIRGGLKAHISQEPLKIEITRPDGSLVQRLTIDKETGAVTFALGGGPIFGMGEGGPQFDRRGDADRMRGGQGGYRLRTNGGRVPIQWLIGASGWAMYIHQPLGIFDLAGGNMAVAPPAPPAARGTAPGTAPSGPPPAPAPLSAEEAAKITEGVFHPPAAEKALPLDIFVVDAKEPALAMNEYARITGFPEMPPLWSLGYQQSHRTIMSAEEILGEARTFREKKLPCDLMIYLGTGFCPSGWNVQNGSFEFNAKVFDEPKKILDEFHAMNFKVALHAVIMTRTLEGSAHDPCAGGQPDASQAGCYWDTHRKDFSLGVDGWWPDEGDPLDPVSRLTRIRMYYEGPQIDRPNERPFALHRNGYAGMQRYAPFLWSGDVYSLWETLRTHVPIGINTSLSGIPLWGTDTGGFVPTKEFTGELFVRWFQFSAFCPLFRSHGRDWELRLPWGWNTGDLGPNEISNYGEAQNPDPSELHNAAVEPICKKYLELRYRLLPYLYSAVHEGHETGLPIMRALWLHYGDDPIAVAR